MVGPASARIDYMDINSIRTYIYSCKQKITRFCLDKKNSGWGGGGGGGSWFVLVVLFNVSKRAMIGQVLHWVSNGL